MSDTRQFRRGLFGYRRREVDAFLDATVEAQDATAEELGRHLASLLTRFAETVTAAEHEAADRTARLLADAEAEVERLRGEARQLLADAHELAAATFKEAERRHEAVQAAQAQASGEISTAIARLNDALASLNAAPKLPDLTLPTAVFGGGTLTIDVDEPAEPVAPAVVIPLG